MPLPQLDLNQPSVTETATFSLGCFWSPDAQFGALPGVVRTRVGYAGGSSENPTYRNMGDHIETLQLDYDPEQITYQRLLDYFFALHNPISPAWKRQYASAVFYHSPEQEKLLHQTKERVEKEQNKSLHTLLYPYTKFYLAEDRHQKYKLQRQPALLAEFSAHYPRPADFIHSTAAARVNGYLYAGANIQALIEELPLLGLSQKGQQTLLDAVPAKN